MRVKARPGRLVFACPLALLIVSVLLLVETFGLAGMVDEATGMRLEGEAVKTTFSVEVIDGVEPRLRLWLKAGLMSWSQASGVLEAATAELGRRVTTYVGVGSELKLKDCRCDDDNELKEEIESVVLVPMEADSAKHY